GVDLLDLNDRYGCAHPFSALGLGILFDLAERCLVLSDADVGPGHLVPCPPYEHERAVRKFVDGVCHLRLGKLERRDQRRSRLHLVSEVRSSLSQRGGRRWTFRCGGLRLNGLLFGRRGTSLMVTSERP